ncbi:MAG: hypothetical protein HYR95_01990 [Candidatus Colwellbacteria bacterium]|nr:hypothetical protein [Candidatus Colwellbacteria bacterium]
MTKINNIKLIVTVLSVAIVVFSLYWYLTVYEEPSVNIVVIGSCSDISPARLDIAKGADIIFKNKDKSGHRLTIGGKAFDVPAGESVVVKADFPYGAATYSFDCDGFLNVAEISIANDSVAANVSESTKLALKETYDDLSSPLRACIKNALGGEFDKAYADSNYEVTVEALEKVKNCSEEPHKGDIAFKDYYDSRDKALQECLKSGLGDEFDKLYRDTKSELSDGHRINMVACLNRH